ncbi:radical SAM protein [uncultured Desulfuromusa sp.]|uniref:B12-binding domain-containing radical SAM protein n=1 Tax=uncultured Desulfuromusa sp. TaxID=219183 RepID=UPI002AA86D1D|nr:radical SAM protein [uncultured Desulfuromusa sp.]
MADVLLIQPPALIPSEPPLSLAVLSSALSQAGVSVDSLDANLGAYHYLLDHQRLTELAGDKPKTSVRRALKHNLDAMHFLCSPLGTTSFSRYSTAVRYLNLLLGLWTGDRGNERLTLGDYQYEGYSVFKPEDLNLFSSGNVRTLFRVYFQEELLPQIKDRQAKMVAISINYLHQAFPAFELAGLLRKSCPDLELVAGGGLITSWQEPLQKHEYKLSPFDRLVFGPGEASLVALAQGAAPVDYYLSDTSAIGFVPDFSFAEFDRYLTPKPIIPVSSSRGCYWQKCLFCPEATAPVHPYDSVQPLMFPDLLLQLSESCGSTIFHLTDNAIPVNILKGMAERKNDLKKITWFGFVRFEAALEDPDFVQQLSEAGCRMLQLGLESGSQVVLDRMRKGVRLEAAAKILKNLSDAGISSYVYIMLGTPGETEDDAEMTLNFLEEHAAKIGFLNISIMNLPRGSELLENPDLYGIDSSRLQGEDNSLGLYHEFQSATGWDRFAARKFLQQRLLGSAAIRNIVNRNPPLFSSNHALFFTSSD